VACGATEAAWGKAEQLVGPLQEWEQLPLPQRFLDVVHLQRRAGCELLCEMSVHHLHPRHGAWLP
jgi:hypothetical protein